MVTLIGGHDCTLDAKGRVVFPAAMKKQLMPVIDQGFVIKRSIFQKCLELYPRPVWEKQMRQISKLNRFVKKNNDFVRLFMAGVREVEVDNSGRILIPKDLVVYADLKTSIVLTSTTEIIEIWDKDKYETLTNPDLNENIADLAEDVMGNIPVDED
jgi:MraZ protein